MQDGEDPDPRHVQPALAFLEKVVGANVKAPLVVQTGALHVGTQEDALKNAPNRNKDPHQKAAREAGDVDHQREGEKLFQRLVAVVLPDARQILAHCPQHHALRHALPRQRS
jgi:hypothetical protein